MHRVLFYWVVGCIIIGLAIGEGRKVCPSDAPPPMATMVEMVAVWPALLAAAFPRSGVNPVCEVRP